MVDDSEALVAVDVSLAVLLRFFSGIGSGVSGAVCVGVAIVTCGETSAFAVSVTVAVSVDISRVRVAAPVEVTCRIWVCVSFAVTCSEISELAAPVAGGLAPLIATALTQLFPG